MTKREIDKQTKDRALRGERDAALEILYDIHWQLENRCRELSDDVRELWLTPGNAAYLREALGQILGGVQPDVALGLRTGDACRPPPSSDAIWWRRFLIRAGVQELIEDGTAKTKTAAFKRLAESRCYPDLTGTGADESIPWTRVRDIYYGHKQ